MDIIETDASTNENIILYEGDILARNLSNISGVLFDHVGVYIGNVEAIHFAATTQNKQNAEIAKTSLEEFTQGQQFEIWARPVDDEHSKAICNQAYFIWQNQHKGFSKRYNFVFNNCEDFAKECYEVTYNNKSHKYPRPSQRSRTLFSLVGIRKRTPIIVPMGVKVIKIGYD